MYHFTNTELIHLCFIILDAFVTFLFCAKKKSNQKKKAPKSKRNDGFPPLPVHSHTKERCGNENAHHRLHRTNPSISGLNSKPFQQTPCH